MTNTAPSIKFKSLYVARFVLEMAGILLLIFALFSAIVLYPRKVGHGGGTVLDVILKETFILVAGIGLLLPQLWIKLFSSISLVGAGAWLFYTDTYRWSNLGIYWLFVVPLASTLWLRAGYNHFKIQRLPNANQLSN